MNILKLLLLPVLLVVSVVSAEQARLQVKFNNDADKNLEKVIELSDEVQLFINADETRKVEFVKDGEMYRLEVSVKNESGEWEVVSSPELSSVEGEAVVTVNDLTVTIEKIAE